MSTDDFKKELRQLLMLISSIRSQDNERYEEHVNFSNEVIGFIKKIQENLNTNWDKIHKSLAFLNNSIEESLDSLLTGINPEGIKETSNTLKEIMNTMSKSMQSMNLENVMRELRGLSGGGVVIQSAPAKSKRSTSTSVSLKSGLSQPYAAAVPASAAQAAAAQPVDSKYEADSDAIDGLTAEEIEAYKEAYGGELPPHLKKQKKKDRGLLKPSDFFGM